ncbi:MAG TPA: hypothetical protein VM432_10515 [Bdellovibrionales bacterium]|nr:hypothetical protein [Bdellovibrionales bacterium]
MRKKLRVFITVLGMHLVAAAIVFTDVSVAEAKTAKHSAKKTAQKSAKKKNKGLAKKSSKKKSIAKATVLPKKRSADKKRQHAAIVAKLKDQEKKAKASAPEISLESSILGPEKVPSRDIASAPITASAGPAMSEAEEDLFGAEDEFQKAVDLENGVPPSSDEELTLDDE